MKKQVQKVLVLSPADRISCTVMEKAAFIWLYPFFNPTLSHNQPMSTASCCNPQPLCSLSSLQPCLCAAFFEYGNKTRVTGEDNSAWEKVKIAGEKGEEGGMGSFSKGRQEILEVIIFGAAAIAIHSKIEAMQV